ncbi:hypothetical protein ECAE60S_00698 [Eoetvoesiella caeni]
MSTVRRRSAVKLAKDQIERISPKSNAYRRTVRTIFLVCLIASTLI